MTWLVNNWSEMIELTIDHLLLALPAILISILVSIPIARFAFRHPKLGNPILVAASLMYAVPGLPLLILIPVLFGLPLRSEATMIAALSIYGIALLVRTTHDAFAAVDTTVRDAAIASGHSRRSLFWKVEFPLSVPILLSGIRVMSVSTISLVTIGALIGVSSLGTLLTDGFQRGIAAEVGFGVLSTIALALILDGALLALGKALTPWNQQTTRFRLETARR
ncbi:MAG: ABC transporter permease subunit [Microbacteriaceae bacterium]